MSADQNAEYIRQSLEVADYYRGRVRDLEARMKFCQEQVKFYTRCAKQAECVTESASSSFKS